MPHKLKLSATLMAVLLVLLMAVGFSSRPQHAVAVTGNSSVGAPTSFDSNAVGTIMWLYGGENIGDNGLNSYGATVGTSGNFTIANSVALNQNWAAGFWIKRATNGVAPTMSINTNLTDTSKPSSSTSIMNPSAITLNTVAGQWTHVTIAYYSTGSKSGNLHYLVGDRNPATNLPQTPATSTSGDKLISVSGSSATGYCFKFTGDTNSQTLVAMSNYSMYAQTSVYTALIDRGTDGSSASIVNDTNSPTWGSNSSKLQAASKVYGGDQLTMRYYLNYTASTLTGANSTVPTLSEMHLTLADVPGIDWDTGASGVTITQWRGDAGGTQITKVTTSIASLNSELSKLHIAKGNTVEIDVNGTAQSVTTSKAVAETPYLFYNGGAESYLLKTGNIGEYSTPSYYDYITKTPSFTITPSVIGSFKVTAQNESVNGEPKLATGDTVMSGDTIRYTYHANYDKSSAIDWDSPKANIKLPDGVTPTKYSVNYGTTGTEPDKDASTSTLSSLSLKTLSKTNTDVTITVDATVNDDAGSLAATESSFGNSTRTYKASTPKLAMVKQTDASYDEGFTLNVAAGHDQMYLGAKPNFDVSIDGLASALGYPVENTQAVMLQGFVTGGGDVTKDSLIVGVTDNQTGKTITKRYAGVIPSNDPFKIQFAKPGQTAPSGNGYTTVGQLSTAGNIITIKAITPAGKVAWVGSTSSNTYTMNVDIAHLTLDADPTVNFGTVDLTGNDETYPAQGFNLDVTNTLQTNWQLQANLSTPLTAANGKPFYGEIQYKSADGKQTSTINNVEGSIGTVVDTGDATATQVKLIGDSKDARGNLYAQVDGNNTEGDYTGVITWTLTDSVQ